MIKTNIKMRVTPEQSKRVQEICFNNGIGWRINKNNFVHLDKPYLGIEPKAIFYRDSENEYYNCTPLEEIDAELFIKTNGTCEETYISKYGGTLPKDYNSALKKIENIRIALNKKVEKNKNQKEQIAILLKQKEEYKQNIDIVLKDLNKKIEHLTTKNEELESNLQYKNNYIKLLKEKESKSDTLNKTLGETQTVLDDLNKTIDLLEHRVKEKETIISYLESKLK